MRSRIRVIGLTGSAVPQLRISAVFGLLLTLLCLPACREQADVVLYVSADDYVVDEVIARFERETGLRVQVVGDSEATKTTGLSERLRAERQQPVADVLWANEPFQTIELANEGVLAPYESAVTRGRPDVHRDAEGRWHAFAARGRVLVYAPDRISSDELPRAWTDLGRESYRGRIAMADPRFGTTGGHFAAMKVWWDRHAMPGYYEAWLERLAENRVRMLPSGNAGVVRAVIEGEFDLGMTDTDDVWLFRDRGHEIGIIFPVHSHENIPGRGTLVIPNTVSLVAGAQRPDAAGRLIDFLLSDEVELLIAATSSRNIPLVADIPDDLRPFMPPDPPMQVDFARVAAARSGAIEAVVRALGGSGD